jgi:hypothetical protein
MDRLASEGTRFNARLLQHRPVLPLAIFHLDGPLCAFARPLLDGQMENAAETTVGDIFRQAGYRTATIGNTICTWDKVPTSTDSTSLSTCPIPAFARAAGAAECYKAVNPLRSTGSTPAARTSAQPVDNEHHPAGYWATQDDRVPAREQGSAFLRLAELYGPHTPIVPSQPGPRCMTRQITLPANWHTTRLKRLREFEALRTKSGD